MRAGSLGAAILAVTALAGCTPRTLIAPAATPNRSAEQYVPRGGCNVRDFSSATDVPTGAQNLGWVTIEQAEGQSDEVTLIGLRKKICEMGGNALSQPAWVKGPSDEKPKLTANAWVLP